MISTILERLLERAKEALSEMGEEVVFRSDEAYVKLHSLFRQHDGNNRFVALKRPHHLFHAELSSKISVTEYRHERL